MQKDEDSFKPIGNKIGEYARKRTAPVSKPDSKGKGKGKADGEGHTDDAKHATWENCEVADEGAVVYEAYQVRACETGSLVMLMDISPDSLRYSRLQGVPPSNAALRPTLH